MIELGLQLVPGRGEAVSSLRGLARDAEAAGYAALTVPDHLEDGIPGPLTTCATLIEATERVRVGTLVLNNDLRHPAVVAREAAVLADLSGGRFELGLGAGHAAAEYTRIGLTFDAAAIRIARLRESAMVMRALLSGESAAMPGEHYQVEDRLDPPPRSPVPILIGGHSRPLQALAAVEADILGLAGFSARRGGLDPPDMTAFGARTAASQLRRVRDIAAKRSRALRVHALVQWAEVTPNRTRAAERVATDLGVPTDVVLDSPYVLLGTAGEIAAQLREHHERLGIERWTLFARHPGGQPPCLAPFARVAESLAADR